MNSDRSTATARSSDTETAPDGRRRRFLALGVSIGATLLAGCTSGSAPAGSDGGTTADDGDTATGAGGETGTASGAFRLLISDQPVAIDEFDSLDVALDRARIFRSGGDDGGDGIPTGNETANGNATATPTATATATPSPTATEGGDDQQGFSVVDLDGATVDLTRVVGEKAITVFDGELEAGRYTKIELYAADVAGVVDGESVDVTIPSGKLQLTKPFEVTADEPVDFVFDINVVERGQSGGYNLLPVVSGSGVAGEDVSVTEIEDRTDGDGGGSGDQTPENPENASGSSTENTGRSDDSTPTETGADA
ncbi:DUF4382 domain-containing protein [Haloplanus litoreus]|uniref:DUF4382 domain-containing protein n=1 Tax=Haloplanus litoreus TaxID=767515 RepID=A0ABD6A0F6_9EURY